MKLLIDNNLPPRVARALGHIFPDHDFAALRDKFPHDAADVTWIEALNREGGWAVLTRDLRMRTRPHERAAIDRSRIVFFFLDGAWKGFGVPETAARLIRMVPKMALHTSINDRGRVQLPISQTTKFRPYQD